jgi:hypothetical protein
VVSYSIAEMYVKYVYLNLFECGGVKFMNHFKGGVSYKSLGTSELLVVSSQNGVYSIKLGMELRHRYTKRIM